MRTMITSVLLVLALAGSYWMVTAGTLEPPTTPVPTMKTLDEIPPSWHRRLDANDGDDSCDSSRFRCVLDGQGVLDLETGLVWEQSPSTSEILWRTAVDRCLDLTLGNRAGWRLPAIDELLSLVDPSRSQIALPQGHPFSGVQMDNEYWSSSATASATTSAYTVGFSPPQFRRGSQKTVARHYWCVRGTAGHGSF